LALFVYLGRSCSIYDKYSKLRGEYEALKKVAMADAELADRVIKEQDKIINEKDDLLADIAKSLNKKTDEAKGLDKQLVRLKEDYRGAVNDAAKVKNLEEQVVVYEQKLTLAYSIIEDKDKEIGAWKLKFDAQVKISDEWKTKYEKERALRTLAEKTLALADRKMRAASLTNRVKDVVIIGAAGYLAYRLIVARSPREP
jgi:flagellar biosynthesis chaperone FliJ